MNVVYLYTEIMPYVTIVLEQLVNLGNTVHVFYLDKERQTPYVPNEIQGVHYFKESNYTKEELLFEVTRIKPDILVVCGWNNLKYIHVARVYKNKKMIPVVCPIDTQYIGRIKQFIGFIISPFYIKHLFTHIWVPGVRQYHFARMLGYKPDKILLNSLTGNISLFSQAKIEHKKMKYPKSFLFVGRYQPVKGIDCLLKAWDMIEDKKGWTITTIGNGPLEDKLKGRRDINVLGFQNQSELIHLAENHGVFILPSIYEPWALVLQEFAAAGLPILCSDACGASDHYVINGFNGYRFEGGSSYHLKDRLETFMSMNPEDLMLMSEHSRMLSSFTTPELSAHSLLSAVKNYNP